ncbi:cytochrome oxidase assembly protein ShyY1 [Okibacterium sp. HSC-33S16]|uniref:SURF1 family protein n=1 Tax=Okibacterium sp. HSC-33S16 TaxID=2910965 RepID=UPI00209CE34A|nr:SURF1 family cytochrome oxidase biogenesis protein [Okibacterium sp. HSC-33S16]MCP2030076.1 cytochrome oxidase assembly protein ShyY1 [Okibacterium sp. HSC-33S16]
MLEPRWIAMLLLALLVSGAFAWLGQWQLERAVISTETVDQPTERTRALEDVAEPGGPLRDNAIGQLVELSGTYVPGDFLVVSERVNLDETGYWVTGHLITESEPEASIAIALGWTNDREVAEKTAADLNAGTETSVVAIGGRLNASQAPEVPDEDGDPFELTTMSTAAFVNIWTQMGDRPVYNGYVVADEAPDPLTVIDAPPVVEDVTLNWLNIFYAVEWVVFAGFAIFVWFHLVKDAKSRRDEEAELERTGTGHVE